MITTKESVNPKSTAIPGYTGYIPSAKVENIHAKTFSATAKESFAQEKLGKNIHGLSTTGLNLNREALIDRSKVASSSKYGKSSLQRAHPGWNVFSLLQRQINGNRRLINILKILDACLVLASGRPTNSQKLGSL